ncbi:MAG: hypothetical protein HY790_08855 [Deltaproteobacteria bacterium]|nr:hypothetical protein [Deltaproteobacteria bacterium]
MLDFLPFAILFCELFPNKRRITRKGIPSGQDPIGIKLIPQDKSTPILLLVSDHQTRKYLWTVLMENHYSPLLIGDQKELLRVLKKNQFAIVLIDCGAVNVYGARIISKIKVACRHGRIIIFCDKAHLGDSQHRELIKEILKIGVYACILAPYKEWEVLSLVSYYSHLEKR